MTLKSMPVKSPVKNNLADFGYRIIQIEITNRCNMGCSFCGLPIRDAKLRDMGVEEVNNLLEQVADYDGVDFVAFHQFGETLLYKDIWKCIDRCRELGLRSQLVTNGLLLTEENIDLLLKHPPNLFRISAQSINPEHHKPMRGIEVDFEIYIDRLANCLAKLVDTEHDIESVQTDLAINYSKYFGLKGALKHLKEWMGVSEAGDPTIFSGNPKTIKPHLIQLLKLIESKSKLFRFNEYHLEDCLQKYFSANDDDRFDTAYSLKNNNEICFKHFHNGRKLSQYFPVEKSICGTERLGILADGTVACCCIDYDGLTNIGNAFTEDLFSILNRNRKVIEGLHDTGELYFDICKRCLGAPSKFGASIKNIYNYFKY